ncbi:MAG: hypothetical protein MUF38_01420 [Anaerolineae bacterium]|jgi:hypothetical protein|nr:hypothetical protein [Anaerolineae bacterium]
MTSFDSLIADLPAPGEPIVYREHEVNQQAVETSIQDRLQRLNAKLKPLTRWRLEWQLARLKARLNRIGWNEMIQRRAQLANEFHRLGVEWKKKPSNELKDNIKNVAKRGRKLNEKISRNQWAADQFLAIKHRLDEHYEAVKYELEEKNNNLRFTQEARTWEAQIEGVCYQSRRLHHSWTTSNNRERKDIPIIEEILHKPDRVWFKIRITKQNWLDRWLGRHPNALPYGVDVAALVCQETLDNLTAACKRKVTAERSKDGTGLYWVVSRLDSADGIPNLVRFAHILPFFPTERADLGVLPWVAGAQEDRRVATFDFDSSPHMLLAGSTNSGKSNLVNGIIAQLITTHSPAAVRLVLIDNKGGLELAHFEEAKHNLVPMVRQREDVLPVLVKLREIMQQRFKVLARIKAKKILEYNQRVSADHKMPRILCVVDEMATLSGMGNTSKSIQEELRIISAQGRAVGIHLILATQNTNVNIVSGDIKTNFIMRVSGKMPDLGSSMSILGSPSAIALPPGVAGRFVFRRGIEESIIQAPFISESEISRAVEIANDFPAPQNIAEFEAIFNDTENLPAAPHELTIKEKFTEADLIEACLKLPNHQISSKKIQEMLGDQAPSRYVLDQMCAELSDRPTIEYGGVIYKVKRLRKAKYLEPVSEDLALKEAS